MDAPANKQTQSTTPQKNNKSLLSNEEKKRLAARKRAGKIFSVVTFIPVVLAIALIIVLFFDVITDSVSWQVMEPANSGETFAWSLAPFGQDEPILRREFAAQGNNPEEVDAILNDPEEKRLFYARNRIELMWYTDEGPFRWVVTSSRDDNVRGEDSNVLQYGPFEGWANLGEIRANLEEGQNLYLNPWLDASFFMKNSSRSPIVSGIRTALLGSFWVIGFVILFSIPVGVGAAVYLEEYAPNNLFTRFIEINIRNLAGVPSIVYGILGLYYFVRLAGMGPVVLAAAITLSLLILPVVIIAAREAIKSVPSSLRQASYGLGATKWQTVSRVVVPNSVAGMMTGVILAVARAIGETAPLLLVGAAAFVPFLPDGPFSRYTVVPIQIYSWVAENDVEFIHVASAAIIVLLVVLLMLYGFVFFIRRRFERKW